MSGEYSLETLLDQEKQLQFPVFNHAVACDLGCTLQQQASSEAVSVAIEIYAFGQVVFSYAMPGTCPDHQSWLLRKRQAVMRFGHSSLYLGQYNHQKNRVLEDMSHLDATQFASHGGAFPIVIRRCGVIGVVGVSGLAQEDDHKLVLRAVADTIAQIEPKHVY